MTREMTFAIREKDVGLPLIGFLVARFTYHTECEWRGFIADGRISLNGTAAVPSVTVRLGDVVRYAASDIPEPPVDTTIAVVFEDSSLLVINKSGNLPCHPGGRYFNHTLWALIKERFGVLDPVLINRIDRETSGLVMIGKTAEAAHHVWRQFMTRSVHKRYTVFVEGSFPERFVATGWLVPDRGSLIRKKRRFVAAEGGSPRPEPKAEWAETAFELVRPCKGFSVVCAIPSTGRSHQIRATLLSMGYPVVGDKVYGLDETFFVRFCEDALTDGDWTRLRLKRQALHAGFLQFCHPDNGYCTSIEAPLPVDMEALAPV